jgi:hypothetical protein
MGTISYHPGQQPGFYQPSPYYRQNGPMNGTPVMQQQFVSQPQDIQNGMSPSQNATSSQDNQVSRTDTPSMQNNPNSNQQSVDVDMQDNSSPQGTVERQSLPAAPVIDPSLDMSSTTAHAGNASSANAHAAQGSPSKPVSLEITQAAMEAVLQSAQRESSRASGTPDQGAGNSSPADGHVNAQVASAVGSQHVGGGVQMGKISVAKLNSGGDTGQLSIPVTTTAKSPFAHQSPVQQPQPLPLPGARPEPMEPMLTEDGEPMLNPGMSTTLWEWNATNFLTSIAELLTQVSAISESHDIVAILDMLLQESLASPPPSS